MDMKFTKMQGIGNDYVYVNCFEEKDGRIRQRLAKFVSGQAFWDRFRRIDLNKTF